MRERRAGREHPELAASLVNLASVVGERGDTAGARVLYERALAVMQGVVAADHPTRRACVALMDALDGDG